MHPARSISTCSVLIRGYRPQDCRSLADLYTDTIRRVASSDYTPAQIAAWAPIPPDYARIAPGFATRPTFVAELDGAIAGFSDLEPDGHIHMMYVHADHQGQGVATALLAHIEGKARQAGLSRLYSEISLTARPFFLRRGFTVLARQEVPLRGQSLSNFRMEKPLCDGPPTGGY
jgi:putative acetyltransferase